MIYFCSRQLREQIELLVSERILVARTQASGYRVVAHLIVAPPHSLEYTVAEY
jgi:hypothetical protein